MKDSHSVMHYKGDINFVGKTDWVNGVRSLAKAKDFFSGLCVQTSSEGYPASCPLGTRGKVWPGCDAGHLPPSSAKVKNE
jgi:hypothetical protein